MVHKSLLCQTASYFQAALEGGFKEATEQKIAMPDQSPRVIERFVLWVYTGKLLGSNEEVKDLGQTLLADLYIAGDIYGIPELQNSVMDCFVAWTNGRKFTPILILHHVYENTPKGCHLQRFLIERAAAKGVFGGKENWFGGETSPKIYPQQYLMDLVQGFYDQRKTPSNVIDWDSLGCRYHVHPEEKVKPAGGHSNISPEQGEGILW